MQMRARRNELASSRMSLKLGAPEPIEQRDAGNVRDPHSRSAILRKRVFAVFVLVLCALMLTMYFYCRSAYLGSAWDWRRFWVAEVFIGVWLVFAVAQVLRKER
jgi:hypothetical protein